MKQQQAIEKVLSKMLKLSSDELADKSTFVLFVAAITKTVGHKNFEMKKFEAACREIGIEINRKQVGDLDQRDCHSKDVASLVLEIDSDIADMMAKKNYPKVNIFSDINHNIFYNG